MCVCVMDAQAGGLERLTLDSLDDTAVTTENENQSHMEPAASSPCKIAQSTYEDSSAEKTIPASSS